MSPEDNSKQDDEGGDNGDAITGGVGEGGTVGVSDNVCDITSGNCLAIWVSFLVLSVVLIFCRFMLICCYFRGSTDILTLILVWS